MICLKRHKISLCFATPRSFSSPSLSFLNSLSLLSVSWSSDCNSKIVFQYTLVVSKYKSLATRSARLMFSMLFSYSSFLICSALTWMFSCKQGVNKSQRLLPIAWLERVTDKNPTQGQFIEIYNTYLHAKSELHRICTYLGLEPKVRGLFVFKFERKIKPLVCFYSSLLRASWRWRACHMPQDIGAPGIMPGMRQRSRGIIWFSGVCGRALVFGSILWCVEVPSG